MSQDICQIEGVTASAYVGKGLVPMVQLTGHDGYVQLSLADFRLLSMKVFEYALRDSRKLD